MTDPRVQLALLYHFCRLRLPFLALPLRSFSDRVQAAFARACQRSLRNGSSLSWDEFLQNVHGPDLFLVSACLEGLSQAWERLLVARANRTETLLVDALRARAVRLYPRNPEKQEQSVAEFWGYLLAGENEGTVPILARYDGLRPLVPWLICVFQNKELSALRRQKGEIALPDEEIGEADLYLPEDSDARWHDEFRAAAREWFADLGEQEVLLLGLRLRYKLSQREVARLLGIHEGNVTRRIDALSQKCHERIGKSLRDLGWTGEDLFGFIRKEMYTVLLEEPRLAADRLASMLASRGKRLPE